MGDHAGERAALDLVGRGDDARRRRRRATPRCRRRGSGSSCRSGRSPSARPPGGRASRAPSSGTPRPRAGRPRDRRPAAPRPGCGRGRTASPWRASPRIPPGSSAGSTPGGQRDDLHVEPLADGELHPAQRRRLAGGVAVEGEPEALREPAELAELLLGERRAHAGDDRLEPGLAQRDHVGVALDDAGAVSCAMSSRALSSP